MTTPPAPGMPRVTVVGWRYGARHRQPCDSVRSALTFACDAEEADTLSVEAIEVDGVVVMDKAEIARRITLGDFDDLPEPAASSADAGALLGALIQATAPLAPHLIQAIDAVLAASPSPDEARTALDGLVEVRDLIEEQIGRVGAYLAGDAGEGENS